MKIEEVTWIKKGKAIQKRTKEAEAGHGCNTKRCSRRHAYLSACRVPAVMLKIPGKNSLILGGFAEGDRLGLTELLMPYEGSQIPTCRQ